MINKLEKSIADSKLKKHWSPKAIGVIKKYLLIKKVTGECDFDKCVEELTALIPSIRVCPSDRYSESYCNLCVNRGEYAYTTHTMSCKDANVCTRIDKMLYQLSDGEHSGIYSVTTYYQRNLWL